MRKSRSFFNGVTVNGGYTLEELEFLREIQKLKAKKPRPSMADVFRMATAMGYRKVADDGNGDPLAHAQWPGK